LNPSPFYRWYVVGLTLVNQAVSVGILVYSFALFVVPWLEAFSVSRGQIMVAIFLMQLLGGMISPIVGRFLDVYSIRYMVVIGAVCMSTGLLLSSLVDAFWQIILLHTVLLPLGMALCGTLSSQTLVGKWFTTQRGIAIGVSAAGTSLGGFLFPLLTAELITGVDWRTTLQILGVLAFVVLVPLNLIVLRVHPPQTPAADKDSILPQHKLWNTKEILTTRMFWIPIAGLLPINAAFAAVQFNLGAYMTDLGFTQTFAAQLISVGALSMIVGKFIFGGLGDRADHRLLFWSMALCLAFALVLYQNQPGQVELMIAAILQGIATGGVMPMTGNAYAARFGTRSFGRVLGFVNMFTMMGSVGSLLSGWLFDLTQTYDHVFALLLGALVPCAIIIFWLPRVEHDPGLSTTQGRSRRTQGYYHH
jgi:MFS family permease